MQDRILIHQVTFSYLSVVTNLEGAGQTRIPLYRPICCVSSLWLLGFSQSALIHLSAVPILQQATHLHDSHLSSLRLQPILHLRSHDRRSCIRVLRRRDNVAHRHRHHPACANDNGRTKVDMAERLSRRQTGLRQVMGLC